MVGGRWVSTSAAHDYSHHCNGKMAEWLNAPVLKTGNCNRFWGSNPCLSANCRVVKRRTPLEYTPTRLVGAENEIDKWYGLTTKPANLSFIKSLCAGSTPAPTANRRKLIMTRVRWKRGYRVLCLGGEIGRHAGLKILFAATRVRVRFSPEAHNYWYGMPLFNVKGSTWVPSINEGKGQWSDS